MIKENGGSFVDFQDKLHNPIWKNLSEEEKWLLFEKVKKQFISPELEMSNLKLCLFSLGGVKNRTFEFDLLDETFVFIPGQKDVILGWESGNNTNTFLLTQTLGENPPELLNKSDKIDQYINQMTSPLRKATIAPMIVSKYAFPASCAYIGWLDSLTGEFHGEMERFVPIEKEVQKELFPTLTLEESLNFSQPERVLREGVFYLEYLTDEGVYRVFIHQPMTLAENRKRLNKWQLVLLDEDQWEYANGAGTRRLFRWGNCLVSANDYSEKNQEIYELAKGRNMFGLVFDTDKQRYELTKDENVLKLGKIKESETKLQQTLPLATYYRDAKVIEKEEILSPLIYECRKAIILEKRKDDSL